MIWYDMIWWYIVLTAIGLTPGSSSTVHIYAKTIHRTTQWNGIHRTVHKQPYKQKTSYDVYIFSNNDIQFVTKTFTTLHPTTLHSTSLHLSTLHFLSFKLHPTTLPRLLCNRENKTAKACLCETDDTGSLTIQGIYACPFINLACRRHQLMVSPYLWHPFGPRIYLKLEWEKKYAKLEMGPSFDLFTQFYCDLSLQVFLLFRLKHKSDRVLQMASYHNANRTLVIPRHPPPQAGTILIIQFSYLNLLQKAHQAADGFNLLSKTGSLFLNLSM
jgi:hypothetical protein